MKYASVTTPLDMAFSEVCYHYYYGIGEVRGLSLLDRLRSSFNITQPDPVCLEQPEHDITSLEQFSKFFPTEEACREGLFQAKWPGGFACPKCSHPRAYTLKTRKHPLYECASCHHQTSITAGTIMEGSATRLSKWLLAIFLISRVDRGISAMSLSCFLQVTYKTAWLILHKIRHALASEVSTFLFTGIVHANGFVYGKSINPTIYRQPDEQPILAIGQMDTSSQAKWIRLQVVPPAHLNGRLVTPAGATAFLAGAVDESRTEGIVLALTRHREIFTKKLLPLFRHADRWLWDTFRGIGSKHLQAYLDEYCCRYNAAQANSPIFEKFLSLSGCTKRITLRELTSKISPDEFPICQTEPFIGLAHRIRSLSLTRSSMSTLPWLTPAS